MKKAWKWLKEAIIKIIGKVEEGGPYHHEEPIPVDPPIKPKEEEK